MLKRVISLVVGVACLMSMTSAFAAMNYTATVTDYYASGKIMVTSTISGAEGDTATYLVYNKDRATAEAIQNGDDIIYVDQYKFDSAGEWKFSYVTDDANIGAKIQVGNAATSVGGPANVPGITYPVTVTCGGETWNTTGRTNTTENAWVKVPYDGIHSIVKAVTFNDEELDKAYWFTAADALWIGEQVWDKEANTIVVTAEEFAVASATTVSMAYFASEAEDEDGYTDPSVVVVGKVAGNTENFGIILAQSAQELQTCLAEMSDWSGAEPFHASSEKAVALPSLGKNNDGMFAVRVYDDGFGVNEFYAATYYKDASGTYQISGNYRTLTIGQ